MTVHASRIGDTEGGADKVTLRDITLPLPIKVAT